MGLLFEWCSSITHSYNMKMAVGNMKLLVTPLLDNNLFDESRLHELKRDGAEVDNKK